jgi:hypothetical protein
MYSSAQVPRFPPIRHGYARAVTKSTDSRVVAVTCGLLAVVLGGLAAVFAVVSGLVPAVVLAGVGAVLLFAAGVSLNSQGSPGR